MVALNENVVQRKIELVFYVVRVSQKQYRSHFLMIDYKTTRLFGVMLRIKSFYNKIADHKLTKHRNCAVMECIRLNTLFFECSSCSVDIESLCILNKKPCMVAVAMGDKTAIYLADIPMQCFNGIFVVYATFYNEGFVVILNYITITRAATS